jgi:hypothetical protein
MSQPPDDLNQRFTDGARAVLSLAADEANRFNHNYIGTEHILLGLVKQGEGVAAEVLESLGVELTKVRNAVEFIIGRGERQVIGQIGLTPRALKVIQLAVNEAHRLDHDYVGTEHVLLGLIREGEGIAAGVLESLGVNLERVRRRVLAVLAGPTAPGKPERLGPLPGVPSGTGLSGWEYLVLHLEWKDGAPRVVRTEGAHIAGWAPHLPAMLAIVGDDGWELVGVDSARAGGAPAGALYLFRREKG